jgi:nucleoside-diphosphate-sugar epimerase
VEAYIRIAECPDAIGKVINIGTGNEISVGDLASTILDLMGKNIPIKSDDQRIRPANSEVERLCAKNDKAQEILNWRPKHSLKQGLTETIEWIENHIDQYRPETYAI